MRAPRPLVMRHSVLMLVTFLCIAAGAQLPFASAGVGADGDRTVIATGQKEGLDWALVGYRRDGGLCVDLEIGSSASGGCGRRTPGDLVVNGIAWTDDLPDQMIVMGRVSDRVGNLILRKHDGSTHKMRLLHSEEFSRTFFVAFPEEGHRATLTARTASSAFLARRRFTREELSVSDP